MWVRACGYKVKSLVERGVFLIPPIYFIHHETKSLFFDSPDQARDLGTSTNKWLMVNVQNAKEFQCQMLNRDVWSTAAVKALVKEHFVFWQVGLLKGIKSCLVQNRNSLQTIETSIACSIRLM